MRFPTIPEIIESGMCFLYGHDWEDGRCRVCGETR